MKNKAILLVLTVGLLMPAMAHADLAAGWEAWKWQGAASNPLVSDATQTVGVSASATQDGSWSIAPNVGSTDGTFGTLAGADPTNTGSTSGYRLNDGVEGSIDFTITETAGTAIDLEFFHMDYTRFRFGSNEFYTLEVLAGSSISAGVVATNVGGTALPVYNTNTDLPDFDFDLTGLADSQLDVGGSATFRLSFTGGNGNAGQHSILDNVAISGTPAQVPEPGSMAVLGLGGLALMIRRRK